MKLYLENGQCAVLQIQSRVGEGGEATVYSLGAGEIVKIYNSPSAAHHRKLSTMIANPPADPCQALSHVSIAWPKALVYQNRSCHVRDFVGFTMPQVSDAQSVFKCYNPGERRTWPNFTYKYLLAAARNLAAAMAAVHDCGYVVGDINESNILVSNRALVSLIDTDSFQVPRGSSSPFLCRGGKPEFTPPELLSYGETRTEFHDRFGLAVLIFQLLMEGTHPFQVRWAGPGQPPDVTGKIRQNLFPFASKPPRHCEVPPIAPPFALLPPSLGELVQTCFHDGHRNPQRRPSARDWQEAIDLALAGIKQCLDNPNHEFSTHLSTCPWCERRDRLGGRDPYPDQLSSASMRPARKAATQIPLAPSFSRSTASPTSASPLARTPRARKRRIVKGLTVFGLLVLAALLYQLHFSSSVEPSEILADDVIPVKNSEALEDYERLLLELEQLQVGDAPERGELALDALRTFKATYPGNRPRKVDVLIASWEGFCLVEADLVERLAHLEASSEPDRVRSVVERVRGVQARFPDFNLARFEQHALALAAQAATELLARDEQKLVSALAALRQSESQDRSVQAIRLITEFQAKHSGHNAGEIDGIRQDWHRRAIADMELRKAISDVAQTADVEKLVTARTLLEEREAQFAGYSFAHVHREVKILGAFVTVFAKLEDTVRALKHSKPEKQECEFAAINYLTPKLSELLDLPVDERSQVLPRLMDDIHALIDALDRLREVDNRERHVSAELCVDAFLKAHPGFTAGFLASMTEAWEQLGRLENALDQAVDSILEADDSFLARSALSMIEGVDSQHDEIALTRARRRISIWLSVHRQKAFPGARTTGGPGIALVRIPAGSFMMGAPTEELGRGDETPHEVTIGRDFWLSQFEVTQAEWEALMGANPSTYTRRDAPVETVGWQDCVDFCKTLNERTRGRRPDGYVYRLPTEAEWEYACRANTATPFHFGSSLGSAWANIRANHPYGDVPARVDGMYPPDVVGIHPPNAWGLYDMHGNVSEWCRDWKASYPTGAVIDPEGPGSGRYRVSRGGHASATGVDCRAASRTAHAPEIKGRSLGFRLSLAPGREEPSEFPASSPPVEPHAAAESEVVTKLDIEIDAAEGNLRRIESQLAERQDLLKREQQKGLDAEFWGERCAKGSADRMMYARAYNVARTKLREVKRQIQALSQRRESHKRFIEEKRKASEQEARRRPLPTFQFQLQSPVRILIANEEPSTLK